MDHRTVERVLQRAVAGLPVAEDELESAIDHAETCEICGPRFELRRADTSIEGTDMAEVPVEPTALFARALTAALSAPEPVARLRAAARLGSFEQLAPRALIALVAAASEDPDERVRAAAIAALDEQQHVIELATGEGAAWNRLTARGEWEAVGEIVREEDQWWLKLNRLPGSFERTKPVVAIPAALETGETQIEWSGESPGLVFADEAVAGGTLELFLGNVTESAPPLENLFSRVYLLSPRERGGPI